MVRNLFDEDGDAADVALEGLAEDRVERFLKLHLEYVHGGEEHSYELYLIDLICTFSSLGDENRDIAVGPHHSLEERFVVKDVNWE